jgi:hypothetical protein
MTGQYDSHHPLDFSRPCRSSLCHRKERTPTGQALCHPVFEIRTVQGQGLQKVVYGQRELPQSDRGVTSGRQLPFDLGKKDVKANRSGFPLGSEPSRGHRGKASLGIRLSVSLPVEWSAVIRILISSHGEPERYESAPTSSFCLERPKETSLSGMHSMRLFMYSIRYEFWVALEFWEIRPVTWSRAGQTKSPLNDFIHSRPMGFTMS